MVKSSGLNQLLVYIKFELRPILTILCCLKEFDVLFAKYRQTYTNTYNMYIQYICVCLSVFGAL